MNIADKLKTKILVEGKAISDTVLKVDSFLNHQVDPEFTMLLGKEIAGRFKEEKITRILTVEASGIAVALATGLAMKTPVVFAKKMRAVTQNEEVYNSKIYSFTKNESVQIYVIKRFLQPSDRVLIVDDFLAHGEALNGLVDIVKQSGAKLVGAGIVIEKLFQGGGRSLREKGVRIDSIVSIKRMEKGIIVFA